MKKSIRAIYFVSVLFLTSCAGREYPPDVVYRTGTNLSNSDNAVVHYHEDPPYIYHDADHRTWREVFDRKGQRSFVQIN